ncbi:MAG: nucleoside kinase [Ruminiclostridium sp.]|nr:nucleoside kinase [Ruminiclostridium sp.]
MKFLTLGELNGSVKNDLKVFIEKAEQNYRNEIKNVADHILDSDHNMPIILISGPSGSAKTTTALRLATMLENAGKTVHPVSMDNYFRPLGDPGNEVDEDGRVDLESPKRLDMDLLNNHLEKFWKCEEVEMPSFDFATQTRQKGKTLKRKEGEFVILEGIHALNPEITGNIGDHATTVYVSVRTRLKNDESNLLHPSKVRLMRRIVRDKLFRGRGIAETLEFFKWVQRGEQRFIMPYKDKAMFDIDTFIAYEPAVYKPFILDELLAVRDTYPDYEQFTDLEEFLTEIDGMSTDAVPVNSLVREFVGGSHYDY